MTSLLLLWMASAAAQDTPACDEPVRVGTYTEGVQQAFTSLEEMNASGFMSWAQRVEDAIPCAATVPPPDVVGETHQLLGIRAYVQGDKEAASLAFAASRLTDGDARLPPTLFPEGHEIHQLFGQVQVWEVDTHELPAPADGKLYIDGVASSRRPTDLPAWFVLTSADGAVTRSAYLWPGDPDPAYAPETAATGSKTRKNHAEKTGNPRLILGIGAAGAAVIAGGLWGGAVASEAAFEADQPGWDRQDLQSAQATSNGLVVGAASMGVVALALGGIAIGGQF